MRILIDATAAMSGGKVYLEHLLPPLLQLARGHEFMILHNGELTEFAASEEGASVEWRAVGGLSASHRVWIGKAVVKLLWRVFVLPYLLWRWQPDVFFSNAGYAPRWLPRRTRAVLALHNSMPLRAELIAAERSPLHRWRLRLLRQLIVRSARRAAAVIVFSHDTRERLLACCGALPCEPAVVYHGIDWQGGSQPVPPPFEIPSQWDRLGTCPTYLLYVSQFHRYKNVERLLAAYAQVRTSHPDLSLVLIGEAADAAYWRELQPQLAALNVVHWSQCPREKLLPVYQNALAFVHPSLAETCSFPLLEALAAGTPVAAARMSALPEIAGDAACYFDPYDAADLVRVLERLLNDENLRSELSAKAQLRAQHFTWPEAARQTLAVLEGVNDVSRAVSASVRFRQ